MSRIGLALIVSALCASAAQAAEPPALCKALKGLAEAARRTGEPQRISMIAGPDKSPACRPDTDNGAKRAFCDAALEASDGEIHAFPWRLNECVQTMSADPQLSVGDEASGFRNRKRLTRLAAKLGGGVRLDVSYALVGRYEVVVWVAK